LGGGHLFFFFFRGIWGGGVLQRVLSARPDFIALFVMIDDWSQLAIHCSSASQG